MEKLNILHRTPFRGRILSFSYRSRIDPVLIPYQSRINPVLSSYRSPIVLLSFSLTEAETIRKRYVNDICSNEG